MSSNNKPKKRSNSINSASTDTQSSMKKLKDNKNFQRVERWMYIVENLQQFLVKKRTIFIELVRKGIPDYFRGYFWRYFMASDERKKFTGIYQTILKLCEKKNDYADIIKKDIMRLPQVKTGLEIEKASWEKRLENVLKAISVRFPELGYVQGMAMLGQFALAYMDEEDCFWFMVNLLEEHKFKTMYMIGFPGLKQAFYVHLKLLKDYIPKLFARFAKEELKASMYCSNWFLTLYSGAWPTDLVARIWDIYFCEGHEIMQRVVLTLLNLNKARLLKLSFDEILLYVKMPWQVTSPEDLWKASLAMKPLKTRITELEEEQENNPDSNILSMCQ